MTKQENQEMNCSSNTSDRFLKRFKIDATTIVNQRKMISNFLTKVVNDSMKLKCFIEQDGSIDAENVAEGFGVDRMGEISNDQSV